MNRAPPEKRNGPESATNTQPGQNASLVKVRAQTEYSEAGEIATAAEALVTSLGTYRRPIRAIYVVPDGLETGDQCRVVVCGQALPFDLDEGFSGPLYRVRMMLKDYLPGIPVHVSAECLQRAGQQGISTSSSVIAWPRVPIRAFVVVPDAEPTRDLCRVVPAGLEIDGEAPVHRHDLRSVLKACRADPRGLPVTVIAECERRAAQWAI